jgi:two-component system, cell cycle sensor histidine kinase and response regulator CckA
MKPTNVKDESNFIKMKPGGAFSNLQHKGKNIMLKLTAFLWTMLITILVSLISYLNVYSKFHLIAYAAIWAFGLVAVYVGHSMLDKKLLRLKQVENELTEMRSRQTRAELVAGFGHWEFDLTTGKVQASVGARTLYGLTEGDITRAIAQSIPLPEFRAMLDQALDDLIRKNKPYNLEFQLQRPSDVLIIDVHSVASFDQTKNTVIGVVQDITARKNAEKLLMESEQLFRSYIKYAPDGVFVADGKGTYLDVNDAASRVTGYDRDELLGKNFIELIAPEDKEKAFTHFKGAAEAGHASGDLQYVTKTGENRWWNVNGVKLHENLFLGFVRDITDRKKSEDALRESEEKYRFMTENIEDVIWSQSPDLTFTYISPADKKQRGYETQEVVGRKIWDFLTPTSAEHVSLRFVQRMKYLQEHKNLDSAVYEVEQYTKDGSVIWTEMISNPFISPEGNILGFHGVTRDITERKKAEHDRLDLERKLLHAQKLESLTMMAGGIAHDFNNQLAIVLGNLELALTNQNLDSSTLKKISNAVEGAKQSAELSRQMQIYTGTTLHYPVELDLNELLNSHQSLLNSTVSKQVTLRLELYNKLPSIKGDLDQILRLVMNIVVNASEAIGDQDGGVTIRTGVMDCDESYLRHSRLAEKPASGRFVFLEFTDTGCGMETEVQHKLFDPFFTTKFWGRGLGMPEVLGTMKGHHGAIMVDSKLGKGTLIRVLFPASEKLHVPYVELADAVDATALTPDSDSRRKTILVVEDEKQVRELCVEWLDLLGYETIAAVDGADGVHIFCERMNEIDIVLMDFAMPRMNGVEAFEELVRVKPDVKVIFSSGYTEEAIRPRFVSQRPASILHKPYDMAVLKAELDRLLSGSGLGEKGS